MVLELLRRSHYHIEPRSQPARHVFNPHSRSIVACLLLFAALPVLADAEKGRLLAYSCMGCHGIEGYRNAYPSYKVPELGGQKREYVEDALRAYRDGKRPHPTMQAQGASLSDDDISSLAEWFAQFGTATDTATAESVGDLSVAIACIACHGEQGAAVMPRPPTLAGQHEDYLRHALRQYRDGSRSGNVMTAFAAALTDDDIAALARFYARQDGLFTPTGVK